ncbi:MAG TPA: IS66 family insertion sequence element accessory protein TnpB [Polyangiaceae bacterium]|nr:IS66 family insertion sequence element accessory protein TnpB [Polyangiaceae bacterium]
MIEAFIPTSATRVVVYLQPVNVRWGVDKLRAFCRDEMRMEPDDSTCFLFVNRARDTLLLYHRGYTGEQTLIKKLDKGSFVLPAPEENGRPFAVLRPAMLGRLFRS